MNSPTKLDPFESALLTELRREVAEHPALSPAPKSRPRRRRRVVVTGVAATVAATVAAIGLTPDGGPTVAPAFAVETNPDGSVDLVIHRLDDADGIEAALATHGIDATVHFIAMPEGHMPAEPELPGPLSHDKVGPGNACGIDDGPGPALLVRAADVGRVGQEQGGPGRANAESGDFVLQFPADSPVRDENIVLDLGSRGSFWIVYPSATPGEWCRFGQSESIPEGQGVYQVG